MTGDNTPFDPAALAAEDKLLWDIITDPANDNVMGVDTPDELIDEFTCFTGDDISVQRDEFVTVSDLVTRWFERTRPIDNVDTMGVDFVCTAEGDITGYLLACTVTIPGEGSLRIALSRDERDMTSRPEATGVEAALGYAETLYADCLTLTARAHDIASLYTQGDTR